MKSLNYTLVTDGSSDQALLPILDWLLRRHFTTTALQGDWADLRSLPRPPKMLVDKIRQAVLLYPCDILFVHRDAETESRTKRVEEIHTAYVEAKTYFTDEQFPKIVCAVPVRMMEAWLLFDELALRQASGNPKGQAKIDLPPLNQLEKMSDPKDVLYRLFEQASGLKGRRLKQFKPQQRVHRLAEQIDDFSPLLKVPAFQALEEDVANLCMP